MSQEMMQFGRACLVHIRQQLAQDKGVPVEGMDFSLDPIYGQEGKGARTGVTVHTEPCTGHQNIVGYRLKIGFPSADDRAKAYRGIEDVHETIKRVFHLQNNGAWMLRDRDSNEIWITITTKEMNAPQFFSNAIAQLDMKTLFTSSGIARP